MNNKKVKIGDEILIISMQGEIDYSDRIGKVLFIDDMGQIHGTWGGCALIPDVDTYIVLN